MANKKTRKGKQRVSNENPEHVKIEPKSNLTVDSIVDKKRIRKAASVTANDSKDDVSIVDSVDTACSNENHSPDINDTHIAEENSSLTNDQSTQSPFVDQTSLLRSKALQSVADTVSESKEGLTWTEEFDVVMPNSLPFAEKATPGDVLDIHDDLKREVAFYDMALDAVKEARDRCEKAGVPFRRPDDFFAEMVKTDEHMAKVKDRLIFENKKIEAVARRKSDKEQKLRAKEMQSTRLVEKAKRKRKHMEAVQEWSQSVAANRSFARNDDTIDTSYLQAMQNGKSIHRKRQAVDKKYGFGGKKGRFKQNDPKDLNNPKGFNPRGHFEGGMKRSGAGSSRKGKRARDAIRTRK